MPKTRKPRWRRLAITAAFLVPIVVVVVYSSFQVSDYVCEVCISFDGREACRTVTAQSEAEAMRGAVDNACGILAGGVTDTLRCSRTLPTRSSCRRLVDEPSTRPTLGAF